MGGRGSGSGMSRRSRIGAGGLPSTAKLIKVRRHYELDKNVVSSNTLQQIADGDYGTIIAPGYKLSYYDKGYGNSKDKFMIEDKKSKFVRTFTKDSIEQYIKNRYKD